MNLLLYDFDGNELGFTDKIISSYRDEVFNGIGTSEFHLEKDDSLVRLITENQYLILEEDDTFQDIVVGFKLDEDFTIYCRSLSWLLSKMIVPPMDFSGTVSEAAEQLLSSSYGCDILPGEIPSADTDYSLETEDVSLLSDALKACLDTANAGHKVRFSHEDNAFYLDILTGSELNFYVSENDCTLDSITLKSDALDYSNSFVFNKRMTYMGSWDPSANSPSLSDSEESNYATYYTVKMDSGYHTRFEISWGDGDYIYSDTESGKWKKSETPPEDFFVYVPDKSVSDKYKWFHISSKGNKAEARASLSDYGINRDFTASAKELVFLKDYKLGDFVRLQYTLNNKTVSVPCQFSSVVLNRDSFDETENPTLKEVS